MLISVQWLQLLLMQLILLIVELPPENETNGYVFIHAEGGQNQSYLLLA